MINVLLTISKTNHSVSQKSGWPQWGSTGRLWNIKFWLSLQIWYKKCFLNNLFSDGSIRSCTCSNVDKVCFQKIRLNNGGVSVTWNQMQWLQMCHFKYKRSNTRLIRDRVWKLQTNLNNNNNNDNKPEVCNQPNFFFPSSNKLTSVLVTFASSSHSCLTLVAPKAALDEAYALLTGMETASSHTALQRQHHVCASLSH